MSLSVTLKSAFEYVKPGLLLLLAMSIVRFLMLPVFNIPYEAGTTYTSTFILQLIVGAYLVGQAAMNTDASYKTLLSYAFVLAFCYQVIMAIMIAIDDFGGIETYYTDPGHSLANTWLHMGGHLLVPTIVATIIIWIVGALAKAMLGKKG